MDDDIKRAMKSFQQETGHSIWNNKQCEKIGNGKPRKTQMKTIMMQWKGRKARSGT